MKVQKYRMLAITVRFRLLFLVAAAILTLATSTFAMEPSEDPESAGYRELPALGVGESFGRWIDVVRLGYDPAGAHAQFSDPEHFIELLTEAAARWERISGIRFDILPYGRYPEDRAERVPDRDQIVKVSWVDSEEGFGGQAGPVFGEHHPDLGYFAYHDGTVTLNSNADWSLGPMAMLRVLTHELGHLIGLGHSDHPESIMFANPYNSIQYPLEDDIRAVQTLYGEPESAFDVRQPVDEWVYVPPTQAGSTKTRYLFRPNQNDSVYGSGPMFSLGSSPTIPFTSIDGATRDDEWVWLYVPVGNWSNPADISVHANLVIVDPLGYLYSNFEHDLSCRANVACSQSFSIIKTEVIKNHPGTWTVHVVEDPDEYDNPELLHTFELEVETTPHYNRPPMAKAIVEQASTPDAVKVKVLVEDEEGDEVSVTWHGSSTSTEMVASGKSTDWKTIDVGGVGTRTLFITVNDDSPRYTGSLVEGGYGAGEGFQTLLRMDITLPLDSPDSIRLASSSLAASDDLLAVLPWDQFPDQPGYQPTDQWPRPYNGVTPDSGLNLPVNNIALLDNGSQQIYSCVRILDNGFQGELDGVRQFDIVFSVLDLDRGDIQVLRSRPFNESGALNEDSESPDCSGSYELTTGVYSDYIEVDGNTFDAVFDVLDESRLAFRLRGALLVTTSSAN